MLFAELTDCFLQDEEFAVEGKKRKRKSAGGAKGKGAGGAKRKGKAMKRGQLRLWQRFA